PTKRLEAKKARAKGRADLAGELGHVEVGEGKRARDRPFPRRCRPLEHEGVGSVEPNGAQKLHARGPPVAGSNHDGAARAAASACRSGFFCPRQRMSKSPLLAKAGKAPFSTVKCSR